ncbi:MAG: transposase, partial [Chitinivibrionales bacterium]|nr:transposase [Chitinivibrionales bacterium]
KFQFEELAGKRVEGDFSGGTLSSDGGLVLLRDLDKHLRLSDRLSGCFSDTRSQRFVTHQLRELIAQRILGLCAGYEDLNDHNRLRIDPLIAVAVGKADPTGNDRQGENKGNALAGASTLNRLELARIFHTPILSDNFRHVWSPNSAEEVLCRPDEERFCHVEAAFLLGEGKNTSKC